MNHTRVMLVVLAFVGVICGITWALFRAASTVGLPDWWPLVFYPGAVLLWAFAADVRAWLKRRKAGGQ